MLRYIPITILLTLTIPPAIFVAFSASSMATGLLISASLWVFLGLSGGDRPYAVERQDAYRIGTVLLLIALLTVHVVVAEHYVPGVDSVRFLSSVAILTFLCAGAHFAAKTMLRAQPSDLIRAANLVLLSLSFLAIASVAGVPAIGSQPYAKPVVIFSEPSHFALAYLPMLMFRLATAKRSTQWVIVGVALALAATLQSLTFVAGILLASALFLRRGALILLVCALAIVVPLVDLSYYAARLDFSADSTNISALVFMQGWQNAWVNFRDTYGLGVGFQQFGIADSVGDIANRVADLLGGSYINLRDGGSTAAKLIGEFGVAGLLIIVLYLRAAILAVRSIRDAQTRPVADRDISGIFFNSMLIAYSAELFIRGLGYFSPGGFLALAALIALHRRRVASKALAQRGAATSTDASTAPA